MDSLYPAVALWQLALTVIGMRMKRDSTIILNHQVTRSKMLVEVITAMEAIASIIIVKGKRRQPTRKRLLDYSDFSQMVAVAVVTMLK